MRLHQYHELAKKYTRCFKISNTTIDLLFANVQNLVPACKVIKNDIRDQIAIQMKVYLKLAFLTSQNEISKTLVS